MKKQILKLLALGSLATTLTYSIYAYGCADGWWGSGYTSIFSPEITVNNKHYEPFFYDDYTTFYNGYNISSTTDLFKEETINDWTSYLKKYKPEVVAYFLFDENLTTALKKISKSKNFTSDFKNQKLDYTLDLNDQKSQKFLSFIMLARGIENYSNQTYDYWDYENRKKISADNTFVNQVENFYKDKVIQDDQFLKNRVWFQVLRSKFYSNDKSSVITFFNETNASQPKNSLYYRGLSYVAGAYKSLKNYQKSNEIFAQLFNDFKPLMASSLFDYKALDKYAFETAIKATSNPTTKEAMYALQGYYTNEFDALQKLHKLNEKSPHLDFLLSRWVNINEQDINTYSINDKKSIDTKKIKSEIKSKVDQPQLKWINEIAAKGNVSNPYIWQASAGYFNTLMGDYKTAKNFLDKAITLAKNNGQKEQIRSLDLFNNLLSIDQINTNNEEKLTADLSWLLNRDPYNRYDENADAYRDFDRLYYLQNFTKLYLSDLYKKGNNLVMSELVNPKSGFFKNQNQSFAMEKLLTNDKSNWQNIFVKIYPYNLADIYESRGIYLFYQDKIDEAINEFEKIKPYENREYNWETGKYENILVDHKNTILPGNPFNGKIKDCNDCDHKAKQSIIYTQLDFLKKIKELKSKIDSKEDVYNNALLVGNAFYNASYFGNARTFYYNKIIGEYGISIGEEHQKMLYGMDNVTKYYKMAQNATTDKEQKAKMAYLSSKLERNNYYTKTYFTRNEGYWGFKDGPDFKAWQGFSELKNNYYDTKYYKDVIAECGYFRTYLSIR